MSEPAKVRVPPPDATARQIAAADPDRSVFVSANAGSGKTHVLVQRVINLLLRGEDPAKILCITFTKAAAANMATRVFETLAEWTVLDDGQLDEKIKATTGKTSDVALRTLARRLFANALETPGGLKVQTIHAFCTRLLHQFPFEADVAARFEVLDDAATSQLLNEITLDVMLEGAADTDGPLGQALATAIVSAADITFKEVIAETIADRDHLTAWTERAGGVAQAIAELTRTLGIAPGDSLQAVEKEYFSASKIPQSKWPDLIAVLEGGTKADNERAASLAAAAASTGRERVEHFLDVFCTDKRAGRASVMTKPLAAKHPDWEQILADEQRRICSLIAREFALRARDRSAALITVADTVIKRYRAEKERRSVLDYDDLIAKTLALFQKTSAAWVLYKLDLGINHVLVDEAQDTSLEQWQIIATLVSEFVQAGARPEIKRTVFAVGDEKQSIFSFQGASPTAFAEMRKHFARLHERSNVKFATEKLHYSFRSAAEVLEAVDTVFKQPQALRGLISEDSWTVHRALPDAAPGEVEIWELTAPDEKDEDKQGWDAPFDTATETSPAIKLASRIARTAQSWIAQGTRPGDVLILVRQRGPFFEAVIRALKRAEIEVAGADRLVLTEHIAIMDLLVLGDALLLPDDDLALATVLKSPLFGFSEEQLFTLAYGRKGPLRSVLRVKSGENPMFAATSAALDEFADRARSLPPFAFYAELLGPRHGRKKILARLGHEAADPLDEFLNLTLTYEQRETPSLQGFLDWVRAAQSEVKRDMEMARDEVRVMTVHGAKGLEAKTVILVDTTTTRPEGAHPPRLLTVPIAGAPPDATGLIWAAARDKDVGPMVDARARAIEEAKDEYRRLLYVGLTRAAERLVVCGTKGVNKIPEGCWHELVLDALKPHAAEVETDDGKVWHFRKIERAGAPQAKASAATKIALPGWLERDVVGEPQREIFIRPSSAVEDEDNRPGVGIGRAAALLRGTVMHRLLQSLPDIKPERRAETAKQFMTRAGPALPEDERNKLIAQALALLEQPRFAALFGVNSRAEVPIVGRVERDGRTYFVSGQVDRLAITDNEILIADYKTNRPAPRIVPASYRRQLALYREVLRKLYPGRAVRTALIWTEVPEFAELSDEVLDQALTQVTSS